MIHSISNTSLLTDLYQLTMAYGYWKENRAEDEAVFHLFFRKNPFKGGYAIAAGLQTAIEFLQNFSIDEAELSYLSSLKGSDGKPLFEVGFLDYLGKMEFSCEVLAVPEGSLVFPHEPLLRIKGPIVQGQLLETPLLNIINFQTLIATKASRICQAAKGDPVLEFGLRRAQGMDGGLSASRAAYIGGCHATSNVLAGQAYGIPIKGTHAHSWVMSYPSEVEAFEAYAAAMPNNCIFLVDTYDTIEGVKKAIVVGRKLRDKGHEMNGIRLDSGDLADLSIKSRKLLDEAGFPKASIVASNDLDEHKIKELKDAGAKINVWGVGTRLATAYDQPALGGVYKLAALRQEKEEWSYTIKLSEQAIKVSNPGVQQIKRLYHDGQMIGDLIYNEAWGLAEEELTHFQGRQVNMLGMERGELLEKVFDRGRCVYTSPSVKGMRERSHIQLAQLPEPYKRMESPESYPVVLTGDLQRLKDELITKERSKAKEKS